MQSHAVLFLQYYSLQIINSLMKSQHLTMSNTPVFTEYEKFCRWSSKNSQQQQYARGGGRLIQLKKLGLRREKSRKWGKWEENNAYKWMHTSWQRETHANGRLTEQAVWQWTGKQNARTKMQQAGVMANSQALIPLIGITLDSILFQCQCIYLYKWYDGCVSPSAQPFRLPDYLVFFIYLQ